MSRPEDINQEAWDAAEKPAFRVGLDYAAGQHWDVRPTIARAIMTEALAERENCARTALEQRGERGTVWDAACLAVAGAISKRGEA